MKRYYLIIATFAITIIGCITPGSLPQTNSLPTADSNALSTMIVQTAQVLASQTAAAVTPSPMLVQVTETLPPEPPASTPVLPTLNTSTLNETSITILEDRSTRFVDNPAGYTITIPPGWLAIRVNGPEYLEAWTRPEAAKPEVQAFLRKIQNQNSNVFRLFAVDTREDHFQHQFVTNINLVWDQQDNKSLQETLDQIEAQYPLISPGITIVNIGIQSDASRPEYGLIESELKAKNESGDEFAIHQWQAVFKLKMGTLIISLTTTADIKDIEKADLDKAIGSFQYLSP